MPVKDNVVNGKIYLGTGKDFNEIDPKFKPQWARNGAVVTDPTPEHYIIFYDEKDSSWVYWSIDKKKEVARNQQVNIPNTLLSSKDKMAVYRIEFTEERGELVKRPFDKDKVRIKKYVFFCKYILNFYLVF